MPLNKSGSKQAFKENVKTEMAAGKPQKQSLAIAYNVSKHNKKKMTRGGQANSGPAEPMSKKQSPDMLSRGGMAGGSQGPSNDGDREQDSDAKLGNASPMHQCTNCGHESPINPMPQSHKTLSDQPEESPHEVPESIDMLAEGGMVNEEPLVDMIIRKRKDSSSDAFEPRVDMANHIDDSEMKTEKHDAEDIDSGSDESLVGQVMKKRKRS